MAEIFKNFISVSTTGEKVIVPAAGDIVNVNASSSSQGQLLRDEDSTAQVHSIYIAQYSTSRLRDNNRYLESNFNYVDLYVYDSTTGAKVYVAYDLEIVPGAPFYIEKNVTLTPTQSLRLYCPSGYGKNGSNQIHVNASTVLFVEDTEE